MPAGNSRKVASGSKRHKPQKQKVRGKFIERHIDQVFQDFVELPEKVHDGSHGPVGSTSRVALDEDLPGNGQHYCITCSKYFINSSALAGHRKTKPHKRRVMDLTKLKLEGKKPHSALDAERAGGMGAPDNGPRLRAPMVMQP